MSRLGFGPLGVMHTLFTSHGRTGSTSMQFSAHRKVPRSRVLAPGFVVGLLPGHVWDWMGVEVQGEASFPSWKKIRICDSCPVSSDDIG